MKNSYKRFTTFIVFCLMSMLLPALLPGAGELAAQQADTARLPFPIKDYPTVLDPGFPGIDLKDPSSVKRRIAYDPDTKRYYITETIGDRDFRMPQYLSFEEYEKLEMDRIKRKYWLARSGSSETDRRRGLIPQLRIEGEGFNRLFGGNVVDIRPQGVADITFGAQFNTNDNPLFNERQRRVGSFNFNQNIQMNLTGNIGEKLRVSTNYNTQAQFDFENQIKFEYTGYEDEIVRKVEIGQVSMPINNTLITGKQSLFGLKTQLQFGKLGVTTVFSQQKSQSSEMVISGGGEVNEFRIGAAEYEVNKHYFLAHFFRDQYNRALENLPFVNSGVVINQIEVWVTNRTNNNTEARDIIAFMDLGENAPHNTQLFTGGGNPYPSAYDNPAFPPSSNNLLEVIPKDQWRNGNQTNDIAGFFAASGGADNYVRLSYARKLNSAEFKLNPTLGYISLNQPLNADEALAVAFRYTVNGQEFQVGEFSTDIPNDPNNPQALYVKLLKNEILKTSLPIWDLMMKNIYNLSAFQIEREDFRLNVFRQEESSGVEQPVIAEGSRTQGKPYIQLVNLDRVNAQDAPRPDGVFDFIEDITIDRENGRIIFPVLEPFGSDLARQFNPSEVNLIEKYTFQELYDETRYVAQQDAKKNRYFMKGAYRSGSGSEFSLNVANVPEGSVVVTAGSTPLVEGQDFIVNYAQGTVRILNEAILQSGIPVKVSVESDELFGLQSRTLFGTRLDYEVNEKLNLGGTLMNLRERPLTPQVNIGDEAISNTIWGLDASYRSDSKWLTKMVNKIPFINSDQISTLTFDAEFAQLMPGHAKALNVAGDEGGVAYVDDFESTRSLIDLKNAINWTISGTPQLFTEAGVNNDLSYGYNRARLAFYNIDPIFYNTNNNLNPANIRNNREELSNHYVREVLEQEVFPYKEPVSGQPNIISTLNLVYYPRTRGPYNYTVSGLNQDGTFSNPASKWGGMMRSLDNSDFELLNVEYIEFWLMDPFIYNPGHSGGDLYFNLGNLSEDILKDGRRGLEHSLPADDDPDKVDFTRWGRIGRTQPVTDAFDNNPDVRRRQDVGLDGLDNEGERDFFGNYLQQLQGVLPPGSPSLQAATDDPSSDNFLYYRGSQQDSRSASILQRYERINGLEGNSKTAQQSAEDFGVENSAITPYPDGEDVNRDNTSNQNEAYYEYKVSIRPDDMEVGRNYITDRVTSQVKLADGRTEQVTWYQFRIPVRQYTSQVGGIEDFRSIRFIRTFLTNFSDSVVLRMARLHLLRGEWREYNAEHTADKELKDPDLPQSAVDNSTLEIATINIEENGNRQPIPYVLPPGIERVRLANTFRDNVAQNEQSLLLKVRDLEDGFARAGFKNIVFDFRSYKNLRMFVHAEGEELGDGDVRMFIRLGTDFQDNYYEYEIPLQVTRPGTADPEQIWPAGNELDMPFSTLTDAKLTRNDMGVPITEPFFVDDGTGNRVTVQGQPDLSNVKVLLVGIRNPLKKDDGPLDDGLPKSAEIWVNELRVSGFDEKGGWAATARLNAQLADFANVTLSGSKSTYGFGSLERQIANFDRYDISQFDLATSMELGSFFPERAGMKIPVYFSYSKNVNKPQYNPLSPDILLDDALSRMSGDEQKELLDVVNDVAVRKSINFTNVRKLRMNPEEKMQFWDIENFNFSYSFSEYAESGFTLGNNLNKHHRGALAYNFQGNPKNFSPLRNLIKWEPLQFLRDINFTLLPSVVDFRLEADRLYSESTLRATDLEGFYEVPTTYYKNFQISRSYALRWDLARSLQLDYTASNLSVVDEPEGPLNTSAKRDSVRSNFFNFGRTTDFNQMISLNYRVPVSKLPYLEWTNLNTRYSVQYNWRTEPLATMQNDTISLGNTIQNNRQIQLNPQLNFSRLYSMLGIKTQTSGRSLSAALSDTSAQARGRTGAGAGNFFLGLLTSLKNISGTYSLNQGMFLPGYLPGTDILGMDLGKNAPGLGFILGSQKDIRSKAVQEGWLTRDENLNAMYYRNKRVDLNIRAMLEPVRELRIELTGTRQFMENEQAQFRFDGSGNTFREFTPVTTGNFAISTISLRTAFKKESGLSNISALFREFEENRTVISRRLGQRNPNSEGVDGQGYADGYGEASQEVLTYAFLSAYLGKDPNQIPLKQFPNIPLPNWRVTYNGLSKLPLFSDIFASILLSHGYRSTYSITNYNSLVQYQADESGHSIARNLQDDFFPLYQVSFVNLSEEFLPLIGADMRFRNNMTANLEYRRGRNMSLSMANSQLSQEREQTIVVGMGYRTTRFRLPFALFGSSHLNNDLNFRLDFAYRSNKMLIYRLGENAAQVAGGNTTLSIRPSVDYMINEQFNLRIFFDRNVTTPETSNSFRTAYSNFGINLRFNLGAGSSRPSGNMPQ